MAKKLSRSDANLVSVGALAEFLGVSVSRINQFREAEIVVRDRRGLYDLRASVQGYVRHLKSRLELAEHGGQNLSAERTRLTAARADAAEMDRSLKKGELVRISDLLDTWLMVASNTRTRILAVPDKLASQILTVRSPVEASQMMREELYEALSEIDPDKPPGLRA